MNSRKIILVFIFMLVSMLAKIHMVFGQVSECFKIEINSSYTFGIKSQQNVAENDTFLYINSCNNKLLEGNVLSNDQINANDSLKLCGVFAPDDGVLSFGSNGIFAFVADSAFEGDVLFRYRICQISNPSIYTEAQVWILVRKDCDCDQIIDEYDQDSDNDGILDIHEGNGLVDTDFDEIPDIFDIDSDNDGITDIVEWQNEGSYHSPLGIDSNNNGWDDAFDPSAGGDYYEQTDTDLDNIPDYLDNDSDEDDIPDLIEAFAVDSSGAKNIELLNSDMDSDGLDDAFDNILGWTESSNVFGSISPLPDLNKNGIRDWRETYVEIPDFNIGDEELFYLYPNPTKNRFSVNIPNWVEEDEIELFIYSFGGKLVLNTKISNTQNSVEIPTNTAGMYVVRYKTSSFIINEKLIINQ